MSAGVEDRALDAGEVRELVIAGWTGRDSEALEAHIAELGALGVPRPASVPCFYRVSAGLLSSAGAVQVLGPDTSGEAEFVIFSLGDGLWVGAGSDHTDRRLERHSVAAAKQVCFKPVAPRVWRLSDVEGHWDELVLRSWVRENGRRVLYQEGPVAGLRSPEDLVGRFSGAGLPAGTALFGGTLAVRGGVRPADRFEFELEDPVLKRRIRHGYSVESLPVVE